VGLFAFLWDCFAGLRFDTFSIAVSNSLFILLSAVPLAIFWRPFYQKFLFWLYMISNTIFLIFNLIDVVYYPFIKKRSTSELFQQVGGQTDLAQLLPQFLRDFWWLFLLLVMLVLGLKSAYRSIRAHPNSFSRQIPILNWFIFLLILTLATLGIRGGTQRVPIDVVNAGSMTKMDEIPLVLNTPFTLIKSFEQKALAVLNYYEPAELERAYSPFHQYPSTQKKRDNVVVLILESFGKEYTGIGNALSVTPFLDSLMNYGLVFTNAFSNGTKSIEGIPAILSSLPSLMPNPFINSLYANNQQSSLATLLGEEGYESSFFHGGINGTMNFDDWAALAGYQNYYGKNEYRNDQDFDGFWGIQDEPFLQFAVNKMTAMKQPFHAAIFTLSSHHPYILPDKYKGRFRKTGLENSESIGYADHSLRKFFESAKKQAWFKNTLFVLVADHTGISDHPFYTHVAGLASIPVLFYKADDSMKGRDSIAFSQVDILPSILNYLGYEKKFFAFGESYHDTNRGHDYLYANGSVFALGDSMVYAFTGATMREAYNFKRDSATQDQLLGRYPTLDQKHFRDYKAFMQTYHEVLNNNNGRVKE
jgi:phosphoglycerol transferase MdoB-like AlkP superfamily enzyme